MDVDNYL